MKLTKAQIDMLASCFETGAAWTTSRGSPNHVLLLDWAQMGWAEQVDAPADFLAAYRITDAGRSALAAEGREDE